MKFGNIVAVFCRDGQLIMEAHVYESECLSLANAVSCATCNIIDVLTFVHDDEASPQLSFFSLRFVLWSSIFILMSMEVWYRKVD